MRLTGRFVDWVLTACESDAVVSAKFARVTGLVDSPARLFKPSFILRVAVVDMRRRQRDSSTHEAETADRTPLLE
jgi:hypothetical protein